MINEPAPRAYQRGQVVTSAAVAELVAFGPGEGSASERNRLPFRTAHEVAATDNTRDDANVSAAASSLPFETAAEAADAPPATALWIVEGLIAGGALTELAGKVKASGKTTFALALCRAVLDGQPFAGMPTSKTSVVYLTEQSGPTWDEALVRARLWGAEGFHFLRWPRVSSIAWPVLVPEVRRYAARVGARLLVVDTIGRWAGFDGDDENSAGAAMAAMAPLQVAVSEDGIGALLNRHAKKGPSGEVGEDGRGSSAMSGAVDVVLSLRRRQGDAGSTVRILHALSRFDATPEALAVRLTPAGYENAGSEEDFNLAEAKDALLKAAPVGESSAITTADLREATGTPAATASRALAELVKAKLLARIGAGKRNDPYRYYRLGEGQA